GHQPVGIPALFARFRSGAARQPRAGNRRDQSLSRHRAAAFRRAPARAHGHHARGAQFARAQPAAAAADRKRGQIRGIETRRRRHDRNRRSPRRRQPADRRARRRPRLQGFQSASERPRCRPLQYPRTPARAVWRTPGIHDRQSHATRRRSSHSPAVRQYTCGQINKTRDARMNTPSNATPSDITSSRVPQARIRTLIVDDEPLARRGLELRLARHADVDIVGMAANGREAFHMISELQPELMFLDVQMPGIDGFGLLRAVPATMMPLTVFVTAFDQYALDAFAASALDYLLKPVEDIRLDQAVERARTALATRAAQDHCEKLLKLL